MKKYAAVIVENRLEELASGLINNIRSLPCKWDVIHCAKLVGFNSIEAYNHLLTSLPFWKQLEEYDRVLIFQHDSVMQRGDLLGAFLQWDYIGAPWKFQQHGGNGGFSLRNPKAMIAVIENFTYQGQDISGNEDVWFSNILNESQVFKLAPREVCAKFSCESIFELGTVGFHAIDKYLTTEQVNQILTQYEKY